MVIHSSGAINAIMPKRPPPDTAVVHYTTFAFGGQCLHLHLYEQQQRIAATHSWQPILRRSTEYFSVKGNNVGYRVLCWYSTGVQTVLWCDNLSLFLSIAQRAMHLFTKSARLARCVAILALPSLSPRLQFSCKMGLRSSPQVVVVVHDEPRRNGDYA